MTSYAMRPKVLLATTCRWFSAARLSMAFTDADCDTDTVCPNGHPVSLTGSRGRIYPYSGLTPFDSFRTAIEASRPDIVVPCDDLACAHLHSIYARAFRDGTHAALRALLERSLGDPSLYSLIDARSQLITFARE